MTIYSEYMTSVYVGDGETTVFPWIGDYDETYGTLKVCQIDDNDNVLKTYVAGLDYNLNGKKVVFVTAPQNGVKIKIQRETFLGQPIKFMEGEKFPATDFEKSLDRVFMALQENKEEISLKQDCLIAGSNITIKNNVISAVAATYTAGNNVTIEDGVISAIVDGEMSSISENPVQNKVITQALATKQDSLTFDSTPTENSLNPVTSGGIYDVLGDVETLINAL